MATGMVLPTYQKYINGVPVPSSRKTLRLKEKYILLLVFFSFSSVCFGAFFFLPDLRDRMSIGDVRRQMGQAGHDMLFPQAGIGGKILRHDDTEDESIHRGDKVKLKLLIDIDKINAINRVRLNMSKNEHDLVRQHIMTEKQQIVEKQREAEEEKKREEEKKMLEVKKDHEGIKIEQPAQDVDDEVTKERREKIQQVCTCSNYHTII